MDSETTAMHAVQQLKNYEMMEDLNELLSLLLLGEFDGDIKHKKEADTRLGYLKADLKKLGSAEKEPEIRKYALKCANLIKDFAWWRVSGKGTNKEKEENKRKNTGWALARVLFPKEKMPNLLNTMTLLVNMYFLGYKTSLLSLSSVPVRLLRKNTKLAIKKQYDFRNKGDWYTTTEENTEEIKGTANKTEKKDKIEQKELEAFFKELDNIKDPKPSKIASFFKKKSK